MALRKLALRQFVAVTAALSARSTEASVAVASFVVAGGGGSRHRSDTPSTPAVRSVRTAKIPLTPSSAEAQRHQGKAFVIAARRAGSKAATSSPPLRIIPSL